MPPKEIENIILDARNVSEKYLVEEFTEGNEVIFEAKFNNSYGDEPVEYFTDADNFLYSLNISAGSHLVSCNLSDPEIEADVEKVTVRWIWNTAGVRPGVFDVEAEITGPENVHICKTELQLAKAKKPRP